MKAAFCTLRCDISRFENGHTVPGLNTLEKVAQALNVPLFRLFTDDLHAKKSHVPKTSGAESKQDRELRAFAKLLSRMNDKDRWILLHMASKMTNRT
jgi:transcriptional regulator with XRE-family HTH domain